MTSASRARIGHQLLNVCHKLRYESWLERIVMPLPFLSNCNDLCLFQNLHMMGQGRLGTVKMRQ